MPPSSPDAGKARKSSVWLTSEVLTVIQSTFLATDAGPEGSLSGRVNSIIERYGEIVRRSAPTLSLGEWCAVCDANNGTILDDLPSTVSLLWANVADSPELGEKWSIDAGKLVAKMRAWSYAESVACAEIVQRFWSDTSKADNAAWLRECGAKIA